MRKHKRLNLHIGSTRIQSFNLLKKYIHSLLSGKVWDFVDSGALKGHICSSKLVYDELMEKLAERMK